MNKVLDDSIVKDSRVPVFLSRVFFVSEEGSMCRMSLQRNMTLHNVCSWIPSLQNTDNLTRVPNWDVFIISPTNLQRRISMSETGSRLTRE